MVRDDQSIRKQQWIDTRKLKKKGDEIILKEKINEFSKNLLRVDNYNTEKMKKIIEKYGWPGKSLVGKRGTHNAWLWIKPTLKN